MNYEKISKVNLDRLKTFFTVARYGNYKDASKQLNISPTNISRHISMLEEELGIELINRKKGSRGEILNEHGKILLDVTSNVFKLLVEGIEKIEDTENISGTIKVATTQGFGNAWLLPNLIEFKKKYPDVNIGLTLAHTFQSLVDVEADLYVSAKFLESDDLIHEYLAEFTVGVYASEEYLDTYGIPKKPEDLDNHKIISWQFHSALPYVHWLSTAGLQKGVKREASFIVDDVNAAISAVENGLGISMFMDYVGEHNPKFKRLFDNFNIGSFKTFLIFDRNKENIKRLSLLISHLKQYAPV